jgi:hypothetical protein
MSADRDWSLVVATPLGERRGTLSLKTKGATLKGSQMADGNSAQIFDGTVNGDEVSGRYRLLILCRRRLNLPAQSTATNLPAAWYLATSAPRHSLARAANHASII